MTTLDQRKREIEKQIRETEARMRSYGEELMAYDSVQGVSAWEKMTRAMNEQLSHLHRRLVECDEPEWVFRQLQGQARILRDSLRAPETLRDKIRQAENDIEKLRAEIKRLER